MVLGQTGTNVDELIDVSNVTPWDALWAVLLVVGGIAFAGLLRRPLRNRLGATNLPPRTVNLLVKTVGWGIIITGIIFALPFLGVDVTPVYFLVIVIGVVTVVSGKSLIENYGAGVILQSEGNFEPGDQVATVRHQGKVIEVSSRVVKIETLDGRRVVIPNSAVLSESLVIYTKRAERRSELIVGLAYGTDLDVAKQVLREAARQATGVLTEPATEVFVSEFADSSINFRVWFWHASDFESGYEVTDHVARALDQACRQNGLTISFPQRTLWWGEPQEPDPI